MIDLKELGITQEELVNRVVDRIATQLTLTTSMDDEGGEHTRASQFKQSLDEAVRDRIEKTVDGIAEKFLQPNLPAFIEAVTFQETNRWGEPKKEPMSFREYLEKCLHGYMSEEVDYHGKTRAQETYNWRPDGTRITHLVGKYLNHHIEQAMAAALKEANSQIAGGIEAAVKLKLGEVLQKIKVDVKS